MNSQKARADAEALFTSLDRPKPVDPPEPEADRPRGRRRLVRNLEATAEEAQARPTAKLPSLRAQLGQAPKRRRSAPRERREPVPAVRPVAWLARVHSRDLGQPTFVVLAPDLAAAAAHAVSMAGPWIEKRAPGASWRLDSVELLPDLL